MTKGAPNQRAGMSAPSLFSVRRRCVGLMLCMMAVLQPLAGMAQVSSPNLSDEELTLLGHAGMGGVGMALLERDRPQSSATGDLWAEWQRQRLELLRLSGQWQAIIHDYDSLPADAPEGGRDWLRLRAAEAWLAQGEGEAARDLLLPMLWGEPQAEPQRLAELRRLIVKSYLVDGRQGDAHAAMVRYEQDYDEAGEDSAWIAIKARVMVAQGQADDAALIAVVSDAAEVRAVYALARLKGDAAMDGALLQDVVAALEDPSLDGPLRQEIFAAALVKAERVEAPGERVLALQRLLGLSAVNGVPLAAAADGLWHAYGEYGREVANRHQLLVGDFAPWFERARGYGETAPADAAALYAWLALNAGDAALSVRAHEGFVMLQRAQPRGGELLRSLYLSSSRYSEIRRLPLVMLYHLVDLALDDGDLDGATRLMRQLDAPEGVDLQEWQLLRGRYQIAVGAPSSGAALLLQVADGHALNGMQLEALFKAVFELQNSGREAKSLEVLRAQLARNGQPEAQRKLLYWSANLLQAQGDGLEAARLYLRSAMVADTPADWGEAARHRAAQALAAAGLKREALQLTRALLNESGDAERRMLLQRDIQRLTAQH